MGLRNVFVTKNTYDELRIIAQGLRSQIDAKFVSELKTFTEVDNFNIFIILLINQ